MIEITYEQERAITYKTLLLCAIFVFYSSCRVQTGEGIKPKTFETQDILPYTTIETKRSSYHHSPIRADRSCAAASFQDGDQVVTAVDGDKRRKALVMACIRLIC